MKNALPVTLLSAVLLGGIFFLVARSGSWWSDAGLLPPEHSPAVVPGENAESLVDPGEPLRKDERVPLAGGDDEVEIDDLVASIDPVGPTEALEQMEPGLQACLEATLRGALDADALVKAGLRLLELEVDRAAIPVIHPTGALRFPLLGTPEGMNAELWVQRTKNGELAPDVLSLRLGLEPSTEDPYIVEGAARRSAEATLTIWTDPHGELRYFDIFTNAVPMRLVQGEIPDGLKYTVNVQDPAKTVFQMHGRRNGMPADLGAVPWLAGSALAPDDMEALKAELLNKYSGLTKK